MLKHILSDLLLSRGSHKRWLNTASFIRQQLQICAAAIIGRVVNICEDEKDHSKGKVQTSSFLNRQQHPVSGVDSAGHKGLSSCGSARCGRS